jgi:membrane protein DedA with SNARE-associated domain
MQDIVNTFMLICAVAAAMAFGVLVAYFICKCAFLLLRIHARSVAASSVQSTETQVARVS